MVARVARAGDSGGEKNGLMESILVVILGHLLGSVPFAYLAGQLVRGIDIREYGTRTVGGSNVCEQVARWPGVVVGLDSQRKSGMIGRFFVLSVPSAVPLTRRVAWPAVGEPHRSGYCASLRLGAGRTGGSDRSGRGHVLHRELQTTGCQPRAAAARQRTMAGAEATVAPRPRYGGLGNLAQPPTRGGSAILADSCQARGRRTGGAG